MKIANPSTYTYSSFEMCIWWVLQCLGFYYLASKQCGLELFYWSPGMGLLYTLPAVQGSKVRLRLQRSPFEEDEVLLLIALPTIFDDEPRHFMCLPNAALISPCTGNEVSRCRQCLAGAHIRISSMFRQSLGFLLNHIFSTMKSHERLIEIQHICIQSCMLILKGKLYCV